MNTVPFNYSTLFDYYKSKTPIWPKEDQIIITVYDRKEVVQGFNKRSKSFEPLVKRNTTHCGRHVSLSDKYKDHFPHGAFVCIVGENAVSKDMYLVFPQMLKDGNLASAQPIMVGNHFSYLINAKASDPLQFHRTGYFMDRQGYGFARHYKNHLQQEFEMNIIMDEIVWLNADLSEYKEPLVEFMSKPWILSGGTKTSRSVKIENRKKTKPTAIRKTTFTDKFLNLWSEQPIKCMVVIGIKQNDGSYHVSAMSYNLDETIDSTVAVFRMGNRRAMMNDKQIQNEIANRLIDANFEADEIYE